MSQSFLKNLRASCNEHLHVFFQSLTSFVSILAVSEPNLKMRSKILLRQKALGIRSSPLVQRRDLMGLKKKTPLTSEYFLKQVGSEKYQDVRKIPV